MINNYIEFSPVHLLLGLTTITTVIIMVKKKYWSLNIYIEHRGRVVSISASYSGDSGFKSRPVDRVSCDFHGFPQSLQIISLSLVAIQY
jgi:hypothetical protein